MNNCICGIYKITNQINGKSYVGQSIDIATRLRNHRTATDDCAIHKAIRKYGVENFSFEIIEKCEQSLLNEREIYWIDFYNTSAPNGYNIANGGLGGGNRSRKVCQYDLQGKFIQEFNSAKEAANKIGLSHSTLCACCRQEIATCGNFQWKYADDDRVITTVKQDHKRVKVQQYDLFGNLIQTFSSAKEASLITGIGYTGICKACNGQLKTSGGYIWKFLDPELTDSF